MRDPLTKDRWLWRSRWAAAGAAIAVSLGGGGIFLASAAPGPAESTIVPVSPARVLDTRNPTNLGLPGPFVSATSQKLQITGSIPTSGGATTVVPAGATGVLLNVTAVSPTASGFIAVRPGDATGTPATSSLNVEAGKNVPNAVQVALPTTGANAGKIDITYDAYGTAGPSTELLIDVVGYFTNSGLQELVRAAPIAKSVAINDVIPDPNGSAIVVASITIEVPVSGLIQMTGGTQILSSPLGLYTCRLSVGTGSLVPIAGSGRFHSITGTGQSGSCSTNGSIAVAAGTHVVNLVAFAPSGGNLDDTTFDVMFIAGGLYAGPA